MKYPITPEYIEALPDKLAKLYIDLEAYVIADICERLKNSGSATDTAIELIKTLKRRGYDQKKVEKYVKNCLHLTDQEYNDLWDDAINRNQRYFNAIIDKETLLSSSYEEEAFLKEIDAIYRQTRGEIENITRSMGFMVNNNGKKEFLPIAETYQKVLDDAAMRVQTGTTSYNVAIREATKQLTDAGLQTVDYASGKHEQVDVAARRAVMTGISQLSSKYAEQESDVLDTPYREISAHKGARDIDKPNPWSNHKKWQGKVYSIRDNDIYPSIYRSCGWGMVDGLEGANCRHMHFPFVDGISERTYTDEQLANIDDGPITYQGRQYSAYEATQKQRQIERAIRKTKREMIALKGIGDDEAYNVKAARLQRLKSEYSGFSKAAGLPMQQERANIAGFGSKQGREAMNAPAPSMLRRISNSGAFAVLPERMSKKHIREIAKEFDISLKGINIVIDKDESKLEDSFPYTGRADPQTVGRIDFFGKAFKSKEELVRTIYHERVHVQQFKKYGSEYVQNNRDEFEEDAYKQEYDFIKKLKEDGKL